MIIIMWFEPATYDIIKDIILIISIVSINICNLANECKSIELRVKLITGLFKFIIKSCEIIK